MLKPAYPGFRDRVIMVRESVLSARTPYNVLQRAPSFDPLVSPLVVSLLCSAGCISHWILPPGVVCLA